MRDNQQDFEKIPGSPIAYWVSEAVLEAFEDQSAARWFADHPDVGMATGNNDRFMRCLARSWINVHLSLFSADAKERAKWFPYDKGWTDFRKWYGNNDYVVNWQRQWSKKFVLLLDHKTGRHSSSQYNLDMIFRARANLDCFGLQVLPVYRLLPEGFLFDFTGSLHSQNLT